MSRDPDNPGEITELLNEPTDGGAESPMTAERLWELVYPELKKRASSLFRREKEGSTLSPTAVVNEAFVRIVSEDRREWKDRAHFYAVSSSIMRNVLIDHARARLSAKRGGGAVKQSLDESVFPSVPADEAGFAAAQEALDQLAVRHERPSMVVTLHVFGGLTFAEVGRELAISERTAKADWLIAKVKLRELV